MKRLLFAASIAVVASLSALAACKQSQGDRCQVDDDCSSGLVCSKATGTCESTEGASFDAEVVLPIDGGADAAVDSNGDAAADAPVDAVVDAP